MNSNLTVLFNILDKASCPEDVFGNDISKVKSQYRYFAKIVHPDHNTQDSKLANKCFTILNEWKKRADEIIKYNLYNLKLQSFDSIVKHLYLIILQIYF